MLKTRFSNISEAENKRYAKIQNIIDLLCGTKNQDRVNALCNSSLSPFQVGRGIFIDGTTIRIGNAVYDCSEINKVLINTEGSMAIYNDHGKKLCGSVRLNVSLENIELFCVWVRKYSVPVEVVSGKRERAFQYVILVLTILSVVIIKFLRHS